VQQHQHVCETKLKKEDDADSYGIEDDHMEDENKSPDMSEMKKLNLA